MLRKIVHQVGFIYKIINKSCVDWMTSRLYFTSQITIECRALRLTEGALNGNSERPIAADIRALKQDRLNYILRLMK